MRVHCQVNDLYNYTKGICVLKHVEDRGKSDSISIVNPDAESCSENQDSDTEKHGRASGHEQTRIVGRLGDDWGCTRGSRFWSLLV